MTSAAKKGNLIQLRAGGDMGIDHQQVQLFFAVFMVDGGNQHAAGVNAHHRSGRQVGDGDAGLADQLLRLVILVDAAQNDSIRARAVVQNELQELLGLLHGFAFLDLYGAEVGLREGFKIDRILKQRFDLHVGKIDRFLGFGRCLRLFRGSRSFPGRLLVGVQRLHRGDKIPHME